MGNHIDNDWPSEMHSMAPNIQQISATKALRTNRERRGRMEFDEMGGGWGLTFVPHILYMNSAAACQANELANVLSRYSGSQKLHVNFRLRVWCARISWLNDVLH